MSNRFAAGLGKLKETGGKAQPLTTQPVATSTEVTGETSAKRFDQANRRGKVVISAYFDPAVRKQLAILAVEEERTQAALLAEALNLLFEKHGRSPIAKA
jgi:hypothetical protein